MASVVASRCLQPGVNSVLYENSLSQVLGATSPILLSLFLLFIGEQAGGMENNSKVVPVSGRSDADWGRNQNGQKVN